MVRLLLWIAVVSLTLGEAIPAAAATFRFAHNQNNLTGKAAASISAGGYVMTLAAGPTGAVFNESAQALGVDSRALGTDGGALAGPEKVNILDSKGPGQPAEFVTFSFDKPGIIRDLLFDGVKDETLEYFALTLPDGAVRTYFDFEAVFRLEQQGFDASWLAAPSATLLNDERDDIYGAHIAFRAGDVFKLEYGEIAFPPGYIPLADPAGNGARWEGFVIVPEPASVALTCGATCVVILATWRNRRPSRSPALRPAGRA